MGTINEIVTAYKKLTAEEQAELLHTLNHLEDDDWDRQMAVDAKAGKLDFLLDEALEAEKSGQLKDLCA